VFHQVECSAESGLNPDGRPKTLTKVFGKFGDPEGCLYIDLVVTLEALSEKYNMKPTVRAKTDGYAEALLKYQTILTAQTFLRIFQQTIPL